jgi:diguanylate cyclase (GGDEF)-like protein
MTVSTFELLVVGVVVGGALGAAVRAWWVPSSTPQRRPGKPMIDAAASTEALSFALCEEVRELTGYAAAVVIRDPAAETASVVAASVGVDHRAWRRTIAPSSAAGRAAMGGVVVTGVGPKEIWGLDHPSRRTRGHHATALPLRNGGVGIGSLIVLGPAEITDRSVLDRLQQLADDTGPVLRRLAADKAERRAPLIDRVSGVASSEGLERAFDHHTETPCALISFSIDDLPQLSSDLGSSLSDAALRLVGDVVRANIRSLDVLARVGDHEFAALLPGTDIEGAESAAERVEKLLACTKIEWGGGRERGISCSVGVAAVPGTAPSVYRLLGAAAADRATREREDSNRHAAGFD